MSRSSGTSIAPPADEAGLHESKAAELREPTHFFWASLRVFIGD
ncbi:hypothetical protein [Lacipirellula parvula]|uniref:Uncharacterized protein n=1 Tax=Lacipirellula parvula TaxID=2650471 RepID=A0A5K7XF56_9BACT|nr:hypothetical protein [Lacipirellula parvula]BBO35138.1 hypothetical protein PLANPX_4750 [Lacipirellula parvula]